MKKFLSVVLLALCFCGCSKTPVRMQGTSMLPTIKDGDRILLDKNFDELKRGDVVNLLYPKDKSKQYIKRIIGLPNESIEIINGKVFINKQPLDEPYIDQSFNQSASNFPEHLVPENSYFVLGDNRDNSSDSRYWGTVYRELIIGKFYMTY